MSSIPISTSSAERLQEIRSKIVEKLSDPQGWASAAIKAMIGSVVTITVALTIPFAPMTTALSAIVMGVSAAIYAAIAVGLYAKQKYALLNSALFVNGRDITDPEQIKILRQFSPEAREIIDAKNLFDDATRDVKWGQEEVKHFTPKERLLLEKYFGRKFLYLPAENDFATNDNHGN